MSDSSSDNESDNDVPRAAPDSGSDSDQAGSGSDREDDVRAQKRQLSSDDDESDVEQQDAVFLIESKLL